MNVARPEDGRTPGVWPSPATASSGGTKPPRFATPTAKAWRIVSCCLAFLTWLAGAPQAAAAGHGGHHALPGTASLDVCADRNAIHLLQAEIPGHGGVPLLMYQRSDDQGTTWTRSTRVDAGVPAAHSPHRGMDPQIGASASNLVAVWMTGGTGYLGSGPMATARSSDRGRTWRSGPNPADDNLTTGHGFADIVADAGGTFHLVWLDGRDGKQGLRYARSTDGGKSWSANVTIKRETCECCWNTLAVDAAGAVHVLFRDKDPRDMRVASSLDRGASWRTPVVVGSFNWNFNGCPHVGGGLTVGNAAGGRELHTLVWSGQASAAGLHHLRSLDHGTSWSAPQKLGDPDARRGDLAAGADGRLAAVWETLVDEQMVIRGAISPDGGAHWSAPRRLSEGAAPAAYPRVVAIGDGFRVFWTEVLDGASGIWRTTAWPVTAKPARRAASKP